MTAPHLLETTEQQLCIARRRCGKGFQYFQLKATGRGRQVATAKTLRRIRELAIPPMWDEVLICSSDRGHIQAVGRDAKGRKQYIYHAQWHHEQQSRKFARLAAFAQRLPLIRKQCRALVNKKPWTKDKALALMVLLLDETGIRIGNKQYLKDNQSHGLTTLRDKHLEVYGRTARLHFKGKSGKEQQVDIDDPALAALVKKSAELPGYSLFRYQDEDGAWQDVDSDDVNAFIRTHMGDEFSCKDFRTWVGTRLVLESYPRALEQNRQYPRKKLLNLLVGAIAEKLGNTVTVCRSYYIHPALLELAEAQKLPVLSAAALASHHAASGPGLSKVEKATLGVLLRGQTTN
jgi:DNA topoisomerase-1